MEPLAAAPVRSRDLLLGKLLTPFLPALLVAWISFALLTISISRLINPHFLAPVFPDTVWVLSMVLVVPLFLAGTVLAELHISVKTPSVKAASALNMLLALPVLFIMLMQSTGFVLFSTGTLPWMILVLLGIDILLFRNGLRAVNRMCNLGS